MLQPSSAFLSPARPRMIARWLFVVAAMIVAIVGFIFACIPGALIVGWILLPIAFVLSIVSLIVLVERYVVVARLRFGERLRDLLLLQLLGLLLSTSRNHSST